MASSLAKVSGANATVGAVGAGTSLATKVASVALVKWTLATCITSAVVAAGFAWRQPHVALAPSPVVEAPREAAPSPSPFPAPIERAVELEGALVTPSTGAGEAVVDPDRSARVGSGTVGSGAIENVARTPAARAPKRDKRPLESVPTTSQKERGDDTPSGVSQEIALIDGIRKALSSGDRAAAQSGLASYRNQFPRGLLEQEATVLEIEIAAEGGDLTKARALARAFVGRHPESSLRERALRAARISSVDE